MIKRVNMHPSARDTFVCTDIQASSIVDKVIFIAPVKCELVKAMAVYTTAAGQTCTGVLERLQGTETSGNGDNVVTGFDFELAASTVQTGTIVNTGNINIFEAGNRLGLNASGSSASLVNLIIMAQFRPVDDVPSA